MRRLAAILVLLFASRGAFGLADDTCSLASTTADAKVTVAVSDGRTSFRVGEIIPLALSFTSTARERYWAYDRNYDRSGRLNLETYCVEPEGRDPLLDYFHIGAYMGGGLGQNRQLSEDTFTATADLNEWLQLKPGHYRLHVISHRVWRTPDPDETERNRISDTLRSNTIDFNVIGADADWQAEQLREAIADYQNQNDGQQQAAARRLRFLDTRESVDALARLYWGLNDQPGGWELMFGLFGSSYRAEAIAAMQREISSATHPVTQDFLRTLARLQVGADTAWDPPDYDPEHPAKAQEFWAKREAHERELMQAAAAAVVAALPQKLGKARALTVQALAESSDLLVAAAASQTRRQLVAVWGDLPEPAKLDLIQYRWAAIAGPEMLPPLKEFVSGPAPPFRTEAAMARDAALQHIFELNAGDGRALILKDLRDPKAQPSISLAKLLPADELRPVVQAAAARVENNDARELDYHLLELFGDESALSAVERVFNQHLGQWACDQQGAMLRYFLRLDPTFGAKVVEASLAARKTTGCYRMLLQNLGKAVAKTQPVAIRALDDDDLEVANDAALALGRWGTAKAEAPLWACLERFHKEWKGRQSELRPTEDFNTPLARATNFEAGLVRAIASGASWICGPEQLERLRDLASPRQQLQISQWSQDWQRGDATILPQWSPDGVLFGVLQYLNLDEDEFRAKLSQMPPGTRLYFAMWKPGQISPPVTMEKQEAIYQSLRNYAAQFGVAVMEKSHP